METRVAKIVSVVFQPLLIPVYSVMVIFSLEDYISLIIPAKAKQIILLMVFVTTFVLPALFIFLLYRKGVIKSVQMRDRSERIFPLIITSIFYLLAFEIIRKLSLPDIYFRLFLGSAIMVLVILLVSTFWKISAHMSGIGGMLGSLIGISQVIQNGMAGWVIFTVICCGLVGFARLKLQAHTPAQVYAGFFAGLLIMAGIIIF